MRILYLVHQFFPEFYTGVERNTLNLAAQMRRMGHSTIVLSVAPPDPPKGTAYAEYEYEGTHVIACKPARSVDPMPDDEPEFSAESFFDDVLGEKAPDIVHSMHARFLPEARAAAARNGIPTVVHLHDYWYACPRFQMVRTDGSLCTSAADGRNCQTVCGLPEPIGTRRIHWGRLELMAADAVITPSLFLRDVFASQGFDAHRWEWIPYGVDYIRLGAARTGRRDSDPEEPLRVAFLGTLVPHKGPHVLIHAVRQVPGAPLRLTVYGDAFHEAEYGEGLRVAAEGDERIRFAGSYDHGDLGEILAATDVVVVPSLWYENFPIAAENAVAAGVPVIATDLGGMREMVDTYEAGWVFPMGDDAALARILGDLAADPSAVAEVASGMLSPPSLEEEAHRIDLIYHKLAR